MDITLPIANNLKTGLKRTVTVQSLNVDFICETTVVLCKLNTYDINGDLYTCNALEFHINLKEKFPESTNTLVSWREYFGTPPFYADLTTYAESQNG